MITAAAATIIVAHGLKNLQCSPIDRPILHANCGTPAPPRAAHDRAYVDPARGSGRLPPCRLIPQFPCPLRSHPTPTRRLHRPWDCFPAGTFASPQVDAAIAPPFPRRCGISPMRPSPCRGPASGGRRIRTRRERVAGSAALGGSLDAVGTALGAAVDLDRGAGHLRHAILTRDGATLTAHADWTAGHSRPCPRLRSIAPISTLRPSPIWRCAR